MRRIKDIPTLQQMQTLEVKASISDPQLEKDVLTVLTGSRVNYDRASEMLCVESFDDQHNKNIFLAIKELCEDGTNPEMPVLWEKVQKYDKTLEAWDFAERVTAHEVIDPLQAISVLEEYRIRRATYFYGLSLVSSATNMDTPIKESVSSLTDGLSDAVDRNSHSVITGGEVQSELVNAIFARLENPNKDMGIMTGFQFADCGMGLHKGDFIVVAGVTGAGKTSLALSIIDGAMINGAKVVLYSLEMTRAQVQAKFLSKNTGIPQARLLYSQLTQDETESVKRAHLQTMTRYNRQLYYNDKFTSNVDSIISDIRSKKIRQKIDIAVIDYMQIATSGANSRSSNKELELADMARKLRNLAQSLQITVIVLSQLNRDKENPVPTRDRLRGSGQIAEAATDIWLLYRPGADENSEEKYPSPYEEEDIKGSAMLIVDKCRFGKPNRYLLGFDGNTTTFYNK